MNEKYRENVGVVVFNKDKKILICERAENSKSWQMPQGGIDKGETFLQAGKRELLEETGISSIQLVHILEKPIKYKFDKELHKIFMKKNPENIFIGQNQHWILFYFFGNDDEISFNQTKQIEFKNYKWETPQFSIDNIVEFKKETYKKVFAQMRKYIDEFKIPNL